MRVDERMNALVHPAILDLLKLGEVRLDERDLEIEEASSCSWVISFC